MKSIDYVKLMITITCRYSNGYWSASRLSYLKTYSSTTCNVTVPHNECEAD